ncbi:hypothetical protein Ddye_019561 [Dipteronia dyeriana]|uniref:Uncharacterized protein n=1 Tax=Dipteronia dyeriana TaxID=168575 RepID=A0AAD9TY75_9ROSI|nr:hypothetical protein Ddye_019561 [Dipteronia dyeriana]
MFRTIELANELTWYSTHASRDGKMRHPIDSPAWETIDDTWPCFASDPRNLRLGLAADGFNPFRNLSSTHSTWPVVLVTYNLPPWKCMSKENLMLTLLIPGPKQPMNDIDVYLQPQIDDLNELWRTGVEELCLRHNLDVMHIEKKICESLVGTLLNINEKTKMV